MRTGLAGLIAKYCVECRTVVLIRQSIEHYMDKTKNDSGAFYLLDLLVSFQRRRACRGNIMTRSDALAHVESIERSAEPNHAKVCCRLRTFRSLSRTVRDWTRFIGLRI